MSTDRDTTRIVRSWLQTDEYESADRVLDAVLDQLDTTPQRRATWWPARRLTQHEHHCEARTCRGRRGRGSRSSASTTSSRRTSAAPAWMTRTHPDSDPQPLGDVPLDRRPRIATGFGASDVGHLQVHRAGRLGVDSPRSAFCRLTGIRSAGWHGNQPR